MKFASNILRLATLAAMAVAVIAPMSAHAESKYTTGAGPLTAAAKLDFEIIVEKFIFLQVGAGTLNADLPTVSKQTFTVPGTVNGNLTAISGGAALTTIVRGNAGVLTLANNGTGTLINSATPPDTIDMLKITPVVTGTVPHAAWGGSSTLPLLAGASNVTKLDGTWAFTYANDAIVAAGTYVKRVTYTLTSL